MHGNSVDLNYSSHVSAPRFLAILRKWKGGIVTEYFSDKTRVLFVSSEGWGWRTYTSNLKRSLAMQEKLNCIFVTPDKDGFTSVAKTFVPSLVRPAAHRLSVLKEFRRQVKMYKPDIIHASGHLMGYLPCFFSSGVPYTVTIDGSYGRSDSTGESDSSFKNVVIELEGKILSSASCIFSMNSWCADTLVEDFQISNNRIQRHPPLVYGPSDEEVEAAANKKIGKAGIDIIFVGNDTKRKGLIELIEVHQRELANTTTLHIVSTDDINISGLENVENHGFVENENLVNQMMPSMDIMVLPTHFDQSPHSLIEGLSSGLPLIATGVGGISDIVEDGHNGFTVSSITDISQPLATLVRDSSLRARFGQHSREKYLQEFDPGVTASSFVDAMVDASMSAATS